MKLPFSGWDYPPGCDGPPEEDERDQFVVRALAEHTVKDLAESLGLEDPATWVRGEVEDVMADYHLHDLREMIG